MLTSVATPSTPDSPHSGTPSVNPPNSPNIVTPKTIECPKTAYYAVKKFDSTRLSRDLRADFIRQVVDEIISNLEGETDEPMTITLENNACNARVFSKQTMGIIKQNAADLGFETNVFE